MNDDIDHQYEAREFVPLDESRWEPDRSEKVQLRRLMVDGVHDARDQNVQDQQLQDGVRDGQTTRPPRTTSGPRKLLGECDDGPAALVEMEKNEHHKGNAENHVNRDAAAEINESHQ